jgi:hypothetical protein
VKHEVDRPDNRGVLIREHPAVLVDAIHLVP